MMMFNKYVWRIWSFIFVRVINLFPFAKTFSFNGYFMPMPSCSISKSQSFLIEEVLLAMEEDNGLTCFVNSSIYNNSF